MPLSRNAGKSQTQRVRRDLLAQSANVFANSGKKNNPRTGLDHEQQMKRRGCATRNMKRKELLIRLFPDNQLRVSAGNRKGKVKDNRNTGRDGAAGKYFVRLMA